MLGDAAAIGAGGSAVGIGMVADDGRKQRVQAAGGDVEAASIPVGRVGVDGGVGQVHGAAVARQPAAVGTGVIVAEQHVAEGDVSADRAHAAAAAGCRTVDDGDAAHVQAGDVAR